MSKPPLPPKRNGPPSPPTAPARSPAPPPVAAKGPPSAPVKAPPGTAPLRAPPGAPAAPALSAPAAKTAPPPAPAPKAPPGPPGTKTAAAPPPTRNAVAVSAAPKATAVAVGRGTSAPAAAKPATTLVRSSHDAAASLRAAKVHPDLPDPVVLVVEAMQLMTEIVVAENEYLKQHDMDGVTSLQERKLAAQHLYEERLTAVRRRNNLLKSLPADQREAVTKVWHQLERRARENVALLQATIKATECIFEALREAAHMAPGQEMVYSRKGKHNNTMPAAETSLALNTMT